MGNTITMYSTGCPKCVILKNKLDKKKIVYEENNSVEEMSKIGIKSVPALLVDGKLLDFSAAVKWVNSIPDEEAVNEHTN